MKEIWKDVAGYEGIYQVSNFGNVKSLSHSVRCHNGSRVQPSKNLTPQTDKKKNFYLFVRLYKQGRVKTHFVHRLVATTFIKNPNNLSQVNHKDGNKRNNQVTNLEWCSAKGNLLHAYQIGLAKPVISHFRGVKAFSLSDKTFIGEYKSQHEAARALGLNVGHVCSVLRGRYRQTGGYYFEYNGIEKQQERTY